MKVEMNWEEEFPECADAVKKLVKKLGHTPVDPVVLQIGIRIKRKSDKKLGIVLQMYATSVKAVFNYYTPYPLILNICHRDFDIDTNSS